MLLIEEQEKEDRKKQVQKEEQELLESKLKEREALLDALVIVHHVFVPNLV